MRQNFRFFDFRASTRLLLLLPVSLIPIVVSMKISYPAVTQPDFEPVNNNQFKIRNIAPSTSSVSSVKRVRDIEIENQESITESNRIKSRSRKISRRRKRSETIGIREIENRNSTIATTTTNTSAKSMTQFINVVTPIAPRVDKNEEFIVKKEDKNESALQRKLNLAKKHETFATNVTDDGIEEESYQTNNGKNDKKTNFMTTTKATKTTIAATTVTTTTTTTATATTTRKTTTKKRNSKNRITQSTTASFKISTSTRFSPTETPTPSIATSSKRAITKVPITSTATQKITNQNSTNEIEIIQNKIADKSKKHESIKLSKQNDIKSKSKANENRQIENETTFCAQNDTDCFDLPIDTNGTTTTTTTPATVLSSPVTSSVNGKNEIELRSRVYDTLQAAILTFVFDLKYRQATALSESVREKISSTMRKIVCEHICDRRNEKCEKPNDQIELDGDDGGGGGVVNRKFATIYDDDHNEYDRSLLRSAVYQIGYRLFVSVLNNNNNNNAESETPACKIADRTIVQQFLFPTAHASPLVDAVRRACASRRFPPLQLRAVYARSRSMMLSFDGPDDQQQQQQQLDPMRGTDSADRASGPGPDRSRAGLERTKIPKNDDDEAISGSAGGDTPPPPLGKIDANHRNQHESSKTFFYLALNGSFLVLQLVMLIANVCIYFHVWRVKFTRLDQFRRTMNRSFRMERLTAWLAELKQRREAAIAERPEFIRAQQSQPRQIVSTSSPLVSANCISPIANNYRASDFIASSSASSSSGPVTTLSYQSLQASQKRAPSDRVPGDRVPGERVPGTTASTASTTTTTTTTSNEIRLRHRESGEKEANLAYTGAHWLTPISSSSSTSIGGDKSDCNNSRIVFDDRVEMKSTRF